jgi:hypothetical protein
VCVLSTLYIMKAQPENDNQWSWKMSLLFFFFIAHNIVWVCVFCIYLSHKRGDFSFVFEAVSFNPVSNMSIANPNLFTLHSSLKVLQTGNIPFAFSTFYFFCFIFYIFLFLLNWFFSSPQINFFRTNSYIRFLSVPSLINTRI